MSTLVLACEVLKPELDLLAREMANPPEIIYLSQRLHDYPEKLRAGVQEKLDEIERTRPEIDVIIMGYGLCGRGLSGVTAKRATLLYPKLHDCIPLLLGHDEKEGKLSTREGTTYWSSPGWLDSFLAEYHLTDSRFKKYAEKFGETRARKMVAAEDALLSSYKELCHIRWTGVDSHYEEQAKEVAKATGLTYCTREGREDYLRALLAGSADESRFISIKPGLTIDMDTDGEIIVTEAAHVSQ